MLNRDFTNDVIEQNNSAKNIYVLCIKYEKRLEKIKKNFFYSICVSKNLLSSRLISMTERARTINQTLYSDKKSVASAFGAINPFIINQCLLVQNLSDQPYSVRQFARSSERADSRRYRRRCRYVLINPTRRDLDQCRFFYSRICT